MKQNYLISNIRANEIPDSRGNPTIKVLVSAGDVSADFAVPSGASTGIHEAHELHDEDGRGVKIALEKVNNIIAPSLIGKDASDQREIDRILIELDGTTNKDVLGGNSMIGTSIGCAKLASKISGMEVFEHLRTLAEIKPSRKIPYLFMNLINGGKHANNGLAFQEYHVIPNTEDTTEAINIGIAIQSTLKEIIAEKLGMDSLVLGDEGGFAPKLADIRMPLVLLTEAISQNNLQNKVHLALDVAASSFYQDNSYKIGEKNISTEELASIYDSLIKEFNLFSIEDPFNEEDFESFTRLRQGNGLARKIFVVGDDLTVTNKTRLKEAIEKGSINAIIIKPNQIGTLTETLETMKLARVNDIELIVSHRSGETDDDFIADLAYAFGTFGLKAGAPLKPERMAKYERLATISK